MILIIELTKNGTNESHEYSVDWPFHFIPRQGEHIEIGAFINLDKIPRPFDSLVYHVADVEWKTTLVISCLGE